MAKRTMLPKTIYAFLEQDGDVEYIRASTDPSDLVDIDAKQMAGVYKFQKLVTLKNTTSIEDL